MKRMCIVFTLFLFTGSFHTNAVAADNPNTDPVSESSINFVYACANIPDSTPRLACFDKAVAKLRTDEQSKQLVVISATQANKLKKEAFGFRIPSLPSLIPKLGHGKQKEELVAEVKSVRQSGQNYVITLKNGQIWRETGGSGKRMPRGDLTATITPKALGSFMLAVSNGKRRVGGLRVKRVK